MRPKKGPVKLPAWSWDLMRLLLPLGVWLFLFRDYFSHRITVNLDSILGYAVVKYFMNSILDGVFPLWVPFSHLGTSFYAVGIAGFFNPLIYIMAGLVSLGMNYYDAYLVYVVVYFWAGCLGFWCLARTFLKNDAAAYLAYVALIFSGIGAMVFMQPSPLLMLMPAVWLLFFLVRFMERFRVADFLGIILSAMCLATSYLPFHFLTVFLVLMFFAALFYFKDLPEVLRGLFVFIRKNLVVVLISFAGLAISIMPLVVQKMADARGHTVAPGRHCSQKTLQGCYEETMRGDSKMPWAETVQSGTLGERVPFNNLFSHLDKISNTTDSVFYIPVICYLWILAGALVRVDRKTALLLAGTVVVGLIGMGARAPVHGFLYKHLSYFHYFRNTFYYIAFLTPLVILLSVRQWKSLADRIDQDAGPDKVFWGWATGLTAAFMVFLMGQGHILWTTWLVAGAWLVLCTVPLLSRVRVKSFWLTGMMALLILVEPVQVLSAFNEHARPYASEIPAAHAIAEFKYLRPQENIRTGALAERFRKEVIDGWHDMLFLDTNGEIHDPGILNRGVFFLNAHLGKEALSAYVRHKFLLYDQVLPYQETRDGLARLLESVKNKDGVVYLSDPDEAVLRRFSARGSVTPVPGEGRDLRVTAFNTNAIEFKTDYPVDRFLVYTDSYDPAWQLYINGLKRKLYQADQAFKGVWLPAGPNTVVLRFEPWGGTWIYILGIGASFFFLAAFVWMSFKKDTDVPVPDRKARS